VVRIELSLGTKSDWVKVFDPRDCTIYVVSDSPPAIGEQMRIDLTVGEHGPRVILRGSVIASHPDGEDSLPPGCTVALGPQEREKVNYLNGFVRGGLLNLRETRRLPLRLAVTYGGVDGPCESFTRDINEEGVFVVTEDPLPEESELHLLITVPDRDDKLSLSGRVSHTVVVEDEDVPGMGIVFALEDDTKEELAAVIDDLEKRFLSSDLPDDVLM
jgi:Tfp pilus assembly protein PilZ